MLQSVAIRTVSAVELDAVVPQLVELLRETVNAGGSSLGFVPPVSAEAGLAYWRSLRPELQNGSRVLMVAHAGERIIGTGQLEIPHWPSAPHRAELQKVAVTAALRGHGIGKVLISALHDAARRLGRSLLILNARHGGAAERLYKRLGYREAGVVPGYTVGPAGERYDCITLYQEL
jgi:acetyltransferase